MWYVTISYCFPWSSMSFVFLEDVYENVICYSVFVIPNVFFLTLPETVCLFVQYISCSNTSILVFIHHLYRIYSVGYCYASIKFCQFFFVNAMLIFESLKRFVMDLVSFPMYANLVHFLFLFLFPFYCLLLCVCLGLNCRIYYYVE